ncbi:reticulocalbin-3 [Cuculus canorus]|uniref:reticulocalbin-3-like n=1 Tax=Cuculus canorus TaxID=55661 RepID=UPI0023AAE02D|nr:reticulocalbin-3-like [Cuculus canorus]XP_053908342.1 reticulocalbin-3 [Cuculus canorus]
MLFGGWLCLATLYLVGGSPQHERGPLRDVGGVTHDHANGFAYDHQAFLGPEEAKTFDQLSPEESQRRLGLLVGLIDTDGDGGLTAAELGSWMERRHRRGQAEAVERGRQRFDRDGDGAVTWHEYRHEAYGDPEDNFGGTQHPETYRRLLARDERRFRAADTNGDGKAEGEELAAFLQPEDFEHMRPLVAMETLEDMDKDGDGFIQEDEYIAELYEGSPGAPEPPWVLEERTQFVGARDRDGDGRLNPEEVGYWLRPPTAGWARAEAEHLLHHADHDRDGLLSRAEVLASWELFVGSRATTYGEDLGRPHDEL